MIFIMKHRATKDQVNHVIKRIEQWGCQVHLSEGQETTIIGVLGDVRRINQGVVERMEGVEKVVRVLKPFKQASREFHPLDTVIQINNDLSIGYDSFTIMAGPCAVENREQLLETAFEVKKAGAHILRGGAYKPRTSPYSFQGLGEEGLKILAEAREKYGLAVVTEVTEPQLVPLVSSYADMLQIGARNMQNYALLHAVGEIQKPVLLKRGLMSTVDEWLMAADYILSHGNPNVVLCERGIRTFSTYTRNTLDISVVPLLKQLSHLPVIIDPSHATGKWDLVIPVSRASAAVGADGIMVEVHPNPEEALSDGAQSLTPANFVQLMEEITPIVGMMKRRMK